MIICTQLSPRGTRHLSRWQSSHADVRRTRMLFHDADFADLFPIQGQPAEAPVRLALITLLQSGMSRATQ